MSHCTACKKLIPIFSKTFESSWSVLLRSAALSPMFTQAGEKKYCIFSENNMRLYTIQIGCQPKCAKTIIVSTPFLSQGYWEHPSMIFTFLVIVTKHMELVCVVPGSIPSCILYPLGSRHSRDGTKAADGLSRGKGGVQKQFGKGHCVLVFPPFPWWPLLILWGHGGGRLTLWS